MAINMKTPGVHHVSLRVSDLERSKKFYVETLGFKHLMDADNICLFLAGGTAFGLRGPTAEMPKGDKFNPHRLGVDHIALACCGRVRAQARRRLRCPRPASRTPAPSATRRSARTTSRSRIRIGSPGNSTWREQVADSSR